MNGDRPMSQAEVLRILRHLDGRDAVVVGGQSIALWCRHLGVPGDRTPTSRDVDFLAGRSVAEAFAASAGGILHVPGRDDASPNSAVVVVESDGRSVVVDFLHSVLGVPEADLRRNAVRLSPAGGDGPDLLLMGPVDCLRSRVANAILLRRFDGHARLQADAAVRIVHAFADRLLALGHRRAAQRTLLDAAWLAGHTAGTRFAAMLEEPDAISSGLAPFLDDARLDVRWRELRLAPSLERAVGRRNRLAARGSAASFSGSV